MSRSSRRRASLSWGALVLTPIMSLASCHPKADSARSAAPTPPPVAVTQEQPAATTPGLAALVDSLSRVRGQFSLVGAQWQFEGDDGVFRSIAELSGDSTITALVACLGDTTPVAATVGGKPVLKGAMCYSALHRVAYSTEQEDGSGTWTGVVEPNATASQLRAAQKAWQDVVRRRRYRIS